MRSHYRPSIEARIVANFDGWKYVKLYRQYVLRTKELEWIEVVW